VSANGGFRGVQELFAALLSGRSPPAF